MADFWEDIWKGVERQRKIQQREQRQETKSSSSKGRISGGRSRGYFSSVRRSGRKTQGMGRTSRISSKGYTHQTSVVVKKIHPNSARYNNAKTIANALNYIAGLSSEAEQKNENVKLTYLNGYDKTPLTTQENQKEFVENFYQNLKADVNIPSQEQAEQNPRKNPPLVQHIIFSLNANTTQQGKEISREEIAQLEERAIIRLTQENELLRNHAILIAQHSEQRGQEEEYTNGVHFHILKSNYNNATMELERDFWTKEQIRNLQREFAINCQKMGLDVKIPKEFEKKGEEISEKQRQTQNLSKDLHKVKSIEFFKNGKIKSIVLENLSNGEIFQRNDRDIGRFMEENDIKIDDEFKADLRIEKKVNARGKEYTTYKWELSREIQKEKEEKKKEKEKEDKGIARERKKNEKEKAKEIKRNKREERQREREIIRERKRNIPQKIEQIKEAKAKALQRICEDFLDLGGIHIYKRAKENPFINENSEKIQKFSDEVSRTYPQEKEGESITKNIFDENLIKYFSENSFLTTKEEIGLTFEKMEKYEKPEDFFYNLALSNMLSNFESKKEEIKEQKAEWIEKQRKKERQEEIQKEIRTPNRIQEKEIFRPIKRKDKDRGMER